MSSKSRINSQRRTEQILSALTVSQLDAVQLEKLSQSFDEPFTAEVYVRRKMDSLKQEKLVQEFQFPSRKKYWKLTRQGYQRVYGPDKPIPTKPSVYRAISPSLERHARRLTDLLVHLRVTAFHAAIEVAFIYGDHQSKFTQDGVTKVPDTMIGFKMKGRKTYTMVIEFDCGTEPVYSEKARESLDKLIRFYLSHEGASDTSYRVVTVFDKPTVRMEHFVDLVAEINSDPRRRVIKAVFLDRLLRSSNPLQEPLLTDWDRQLSAMLPGHAAAAQTIPSPLLDAELVAC